MSHRKSDLGIPCTRKSAKVALGVVPILPARIALGAPLGVEADVVFDAVGGDAALAAPKLSATASAAVDAVDDVKRRVMDLFPGSACLS